MHVYVHWIYYFDSELSNVMCLLFMIVYGVFALALQSISSLHSEINGSLKSSPAMQISTNQIFYAPFNTGNEMQRNNMKLHLNKM